MNQQHYQPLTKSPVTSRVTAGWRVVGTKTSADEYRSYTINVSRYWHVYRHKPKWFGQHAGDRYLGKLRWVSQHVDGKQHHGFTQRGDLDGVVVVAETEKQTDLIVHALLTAKGYVTQHDTGWMRREYAWYLPSKYPQQIKCNACGMTCAEARRNRAKREAELRWGKGQWEAFIIARETVVCRCEYKARWDVIEDRIKTGEGLSYA